MKKWLFLLLPVMVFFLFNCAAPIVQVSYDIQGTVKKSDGTPVPNVTVVAGTKQTQTDASGKWSITGLTGNVTVSAQLQDYYIVVSGTAKQTEQVSSQATIDFTAYSETEDFGGGQGTSDDPYVIVTAQQLNNMRNYVDKHFRQIRDIDLDDLKIKVDPVEYNWTPVATDSTEAFTGSYDGMGFEIKNAVIGGKTDSDQYFGFFAYVTGATIKNIILNNFQVNYDASYSGIFAGCIESSVIENIVIKNSSITESSYIGGFTGYTSSSTITNCTIENTTVKADPDNGGYYVGGFVADANATLFKNCLMRNVQVHSANSSNMMGGFVASSNMSGFENCSFEGTIDATATYIGGFVGYAHWHEDEPGKMTFDTFQ
ncbi:MAG: carboxypeptidase-like regulatory domain-containing protein, partial [Pseudothermotoga sp.]